jgi:hypothetical protein
MDEPLFGAAMEYLQEAADGLTLEEQRQAVLAVRAANPALYAANLGASRAGSVLRLHGKGAQNNQRKLVLYTMSLGDTLGWNRREGTCHTWSR